MDPRIRQLQSEIVFSPWLMRRSLMGPLRQRLWGHPGFDEWQRVIDASGLLGNDLMNEYGSSSEELLLAVAKLLESVPHCEECSGRTSEEELKRRMVRFLGLFHGEDVRIAASCFLMVGCCGLRTFGKMSSLCHQWRWLLRLVENSPSDEDTGFSAVERLHRSAKLFVEQRKVDAFALVFENSQKWMYEQLAETMQLQDSKPWVENMVASSLNSNLAWIEAGLEVTCLRKSYRNVTLPHVYPFLDLSAHEGIGGSVSLTSLWSSISNSRNLGREIHVQKGINQPPDIQYSLNGESLRFKHKVIQFFFPEEAKCPYLDENGDEIDKSDLIGAVDNIEPLFHSATESSLFTGAKALPYLQAFVHHFKATEDCFQSFWEFLESNDCISDVLQPIYESLMDADCEKVPKSMMESDEFDCNNHDFNNVGDFEVFSAGSETTYATVGDNSVKTWLLGVGEEPKCALRSDRFKALLDFAGVTVPEVPIMKQEEVEQFRSCIKRESNFVVSELEVEMSDEGVRSVLQQLVKTLVSIGAYDEDMLCESMNCDEWENNSEVFDDWEWEESFDDIEDHENYKLIL